jgi:hypothetical protein
MPKMMNAMAVVRNQANSPTAVEKKAQVGRKADAEKTRHEWKDASLDSFDRDKNGKISWAEYLAARRGGATNDSDDDDLGHFEARMHKIREILIYLVFMVFFTLSSIRDLDNSNLYYFGKNLQDQFTKVEMDGAHSPVWAKAFVDVTTVEEFFHFLYGPVTHTAFSANTFDADSSYKFEGGRRKASTLGYGKVLGGVRISQLRSKSFDCQYHVHEAISDYWNFTCYGSESWFGFGDFSLETELKEDFGNFTLPHFEEPSTFKYNGVQAWTGKPKLEETSGEPAEVIAYERGKYMSTFKTKKYRAYPSPAYHITLPPTLGRAQAQEIMLYLQSSGYVDLHTRAIFVDANVYNPMLDRVCACRMIGEITSAGGVMPTFDFQSVRLWERVSAVDELYVMMTAVVGCFYGWYFYDLVKHFRKKGWAALSSFLAWTQIANIVFFFAAVGCQVYAEAMYPAKMDPKSVEYFDLGPSIRFKGWAMCIQGINVFLNWFKLISILGYSSTFALVNGTIERSASRVGGFLLVFFVIFYGFSQTHCMVFQGRLEEFRTVGDSMYTLMRSLLGDFDFTTLQESNIYMGPVLFIFFVILAVFVVLNMLIAIISDAYMEVQQELENKPDVDLMEDIKDFIIIQVLHGNNKFMLKALKIVMPKTISQWSGIGGPDANSTASSASIVPVADSPKPNSPMAAFAPAAPGAPGSMEAMAAAMQASHAATHGHGYHHHSPSAAALMGHIELLQKEIVSMRHEQRESRQVTALLIREVQGTLAVVKSAAHAASPSKKQPGDGTSATGRPSQVLPELIATREV